MTTVNKGPFMEFIRIKGATADATYVQEVSNTPSSKTEKMATLIHQIFLGVGTPAPFAGQDRTMSIQITKDSKTAIVGQDDPDVLVKGTKGRFMAYEPFIGVQIEDQLELINMGWSYFKPAILYPKAQIFMGGKSSAALVLSYEAVIGYTLERVSDEAFIAALVD